MLLKKSILPINSCNKRNYDPVQKSLFSITNNNLFNEDHSSDKFSSSMTSNNINYSINLSQINIIQQTTNTNINTSFQSQDVKTQKNLDNFFKKYSYFLELIIIYGYFIQQKMPNIIKSKFTLPLNFSNEISKLFND